jgi:hypothetical protein
VIQYLPPNTLASPQQIAARHSVVRAWLERGIRPSSVATMASVRFEISRSTAYEDIKKVSADIDMSDDGPAEEEEQISQASVLASLQHHFDIACATGDIKSMTQLVTAIDRAKKWSAPCQTSASPFA